MKLKFLLLLPMLFVQTACASNSAQEYYAAVKASQDAATMIAAARYQALAQMAQSGEPGAATAATMAIALSQTPTVTPQYIESNALKWAQVLTPTIGTLGLGAINAAVSMNSSDNAMEVQMASFETNKAIQLGNQGMVTSLGTNWASAAAAGGTATAEIALAGFDALNIAGGQTVEMGIAGLNTADSIATTGLTTTGAVATAGFAQIGATAEDGMNATANVGLAGMTNLVELGTTGITTAETLGKWGMEGIWTTNQDWLNYSETRDTNFSSILSDFNTTIQQFGTDLGTPVTCQDDGTGTWTCQ